VFVSYLPLKYLAVTAAFAGLGNNRRQAGAARVLRLRRGQLVATAASGACDVPPERLGPP